MARYITVTVGCDWDGCDQLATEDEGTITPMAVAIDGKQGREFLLCKAHRDTVDEMLLPLMQAAKPRPALTFTYDKPSPATRPDYRLVLVFDPALNLNSDPVCAGEPPRFRPGTPGRFYVYAIYCRNDRAMSQTTAWTDATGPTDPRIERLFRELFPVVFSEQQNRWALSDPNFR